MHKPFFGRQGRGLACISASTWATGFNSPRSALPLTVSTSGVWVSFLLTLIAGAPRSGKMRSYASFLGIGAVVFRLCSRGATGVRLSMDRSGPGGLERGKGRWRRGPAPGSAPRSLAGSETANSIRAGGNRKFWPGEDGSRRTALTTFFDDRLRVSRSRAFRLRPPFDRYRIQADLPQWNFPRLWRRTRTDQLRAWPSLF